MPNEKQPIPPRAARSCSMRPGRRACFLACAGKIRGSPRTDLWQSFLLQDKGRPARAVDACTRLFRHFLPKALQRTRERARGTTIVRTGDWRLAADDRCGVGTLWALPFQLSDASAHAAVLNPLLHHAKGAANTARSHGAWHQRTRAKTFVDSVRARDAGPHPQLVVATRT